MENDSDKATCLACPWSHHRIHCQHHRHLKKRKPEHRVRIKLHQQEWEEDARQEDARGREGITNTLALP